MDNDIHVHNLEDRCQELLASLSTVLHEAKNTDDVSVWAYINALDVVKKRLTESLDLLETID